MHIEPEVRATNLARGARVRVCACVCCGGARNIMANIQIRIVAAARGVANLINMRAQRMRVFGCYEFDGDGRKPNDSAWKMSIIMLSTK